MDAMEPAASNRASSNSSSDVIRLNEERIQTLANLLSLVAIIGRMDTAAIQRVLVSLGSELVDISPSAKVNTDIVKKLLAQIAKEQGEEAAMQIATDLAFVARAWQPVLQQFNEDDPHRLMPYAEIIYAFFNYSGRALQEYEAFELFGGTELTLPMRSLSAAMRPYTLPEDNLLWEMVGFTDPPDAVLVASNINTMYLMKAASSGIDLRFSTIERNSENENRRDTDSRVDSAEFAAFVAGLLGDMLYWTARIRSHVLPGQQVWKQIQTLLLSQE